MEPSEQPQSPPIQVTPGEPLPGGDWLSQKREKERAEREELERRHPKWAAEKKRKEAPDWFKP